jgi:hypothetical protein
LYGSSGGLSGVGDQLFRQGSGGLSDTHDADDFFGWALVAGSFAGGPGLAIGVPGEDAASIGNSGAVHVLRGGPAGLTGVGSQQFRQGVGGVFGTPEAGDSFGSALAAGDFDASGGTDLAVGVPGEQAGGAQNAGVVHVLYATTAGLTGVGSRLIRQDLDGLFGVPEVGDAFGATLAAGDFNGGGRSDLAIGVPGEDAGGAADAGVVHVLYGSATGLTVAGSRLIRQDLDGLFGTPEVGDRFGAALTTGDFNGGGWADLVIGVAKEDAGGVTDVGVVQVLYGSASGLTVTGSQLFRQGIDGLDAFPDPGDMFGGFGLAAG